MKHVGIKKELDQQIIEAFIWRFGPLSSSNIYELTHMQRSEISRIVRRLIKDGRIQEAGRGDNPLGRKRVLMRLNADYGFVLGVGFDDRDVEASVMDLQLKMRSHVSESASMESGAEGVVNQLLSCARTAISQAGLDATMLLGIGVAVPGLVNNQKGVLVMSSMIEFLKQVPFQAIFEKEFGVPASVENLTRAKAVAERALGAGEKAEDMIYVEYGSRGIGAGIIINRKLFYGSDYGAGEFGHIHIMEDGPACKCGSFGCLEAIAGAAAIEAKIRKAIAEGIRSEALALADGDPNKISGWTVLNAASIGDKACATILEQMGNYLGLGLANLVNLFNPSVLVIDQRLSLAGEDFVEHIIKVVKRQALSHLSKSLVVRFGKLGRDACVLGAGLLVLEKHFEIPTLWTCPHF